jgi:DNA-binding response OmpR family regulator
VATTASVLLVMRKGPARDAVARALRAAGGEVAAARDPYEGTARFAESPTRLVVASLDGWRRRDLGFLRAVRARSADTALVLLVPDGGRRLAVAALEAGADSYLLEPADPAEVTAVARRLLSRPAGRAGGAAGEGVARLSGEVAHAVNNPLQVLGLLLEEAGRSKATDAEIVAGMRREVARIRDAVELLTAYAGIETPTTERFSLGEAMAERIRAAQEEGAVAPVGPPPRPDVEVVADAAQVRRGLDTILRFLAARSAERPVPLRSAARRVRESGRRRTEAAVRARGVHVPEEDWEGLASSVVLTDDRTRLPYPGLALARAVAEGHGGTFTFRDTGPGTILAMRFPG